MWSSSGVVFIGGAGGDLVDEDINGGFDYEGCFVECSFNVHWFWWSFC